MIAPQLETDRLILRGHSAADLEECAALWADPTVTKFIGGRPFSTEETWARLLRYIGHWSAMNFGFWIAREKGSERYVGEVGFAEFKREMTPSFGAAPEAGWVLMPWAHGRGFATELVRAASAWLEAERGPERTVCMIDPGNVASIRVAEKSGYREWTRAEYKGSQVILFERLPG